MNAKEKFDEAVFRCDKAVESIKQLFGNSNNPDELRLRGKIEGIRLAEAYFETALSEELATLQSRLDAADERIIELEQLLDWAREWVKQESLWNEITAALDSAAGQQEQEA